jgi:hypothetical protein
MNMDRQASQGFILIRINVSTYGLFNDNLTSSDHRVE